MGNVFVLGWAPGKAKPETGMWLELVYGNRTPGSSREEAGRMRKRRGMLWRLLLSAREASLPRMSKEHRECLPPPYLLSQVGRFIAPQLCHGPTDSHLPLVQGTLTRDIASSEKVLRHRD